MKSILKLSVAAAVFLGGTTIQASAVKSVSPNSQIDATINVPFSMFEQYKKAYSVENLDIHGVNREEKFVIVRPSEHLKNYLEKLNFVSQASPKSASVSNVADYLKPDELISELEAIADAYPKITRLIEVGNSLQGRPILGIEISDGFETDKPVVSFNGMHHARELMTVEVVLSIADKLTSQFKSDPEVKGFLRDFKIVVIPQVNPDGNQIVHERDNWWRKNARANSRDAVFGVDLNRNYSTGWNSCGGSSGRESSDTYRGPEPESEPETKAMMAFFDEYRPVANISYHSYSELIIFPFGCRNKQNTARDLFMKMGLEMKKGIVDDKGKTNTYALGSAPEVIYQADGTDLDSHWQEFGVLSYTIEVNSSAQGFQPNYSRWRDVTIAGQEQGWKALIRSSRESAVQFTTSEDYDYRVVDATGESFAGEVGPKFFKARKGKLNHRVLLPGEFTFEFFKNGQLVKAKKVKVGSGISMLGKF